MTQSFSIVMLGIKPGRRWKTSLFRRTSFTGDFWNTLHQWCSEKQIQYRSVQYMYTKRLLLVNVNSPRKWEEQRMGWIKIGRKIETNGLRVLQVKWYDLKPVLVLVVVSIVSRNSLQNASTPPPDKKIRLEDRIKTSLYKYLQYI